jgi:hypothetical protein
MTTIGDKLTSLGEILRSIHSIERDECIVGLYIRQPTSTQASKIIDLQKDNAILILARLAELLNDELSASMGNIFTKNDEEDS